MNLLDKEVGCLMRDALSTSTSIGCLTVWTVEGEAVILLFPGGHINASAQAGGQHKNGADSETYNEGHLSNPP